MKRSEVYEMIDGERDFQDEMAAKYDWGTRQTINGQSSGAINHEVGSFVLLLDEYVRRAKVAYADTTGYRLPNSDDPVLDVIRKIAAIAVACGEKHGLPPRKKG